jgi:hypothetical protein
MTLPFGLSLPAPSPIFLSFSSFLLTPTRDFKGTDGRHTLVSPCSYNPFQKKKEKEQKRLAPEGLTSALGKHAAHKIGKGATWTWSK